MLWPLTDRFTARYWGKIFLGYAACEALIQLLLWIILNYSRDHTVTNLEFHLVMWVFQCVLIWPIWWIAHAFSRQPVIIQVLVNIAFFALYTVVWFEGIQNLVRDTHQALMSITRSPGDRMESVVDSAVHIHYQILKHGFRLSWYFLAAFFLHYRKAERKRRELALSNKELELQLLTWHLNPAFYFDAIRHLQKLSEVNPRSCTRPLLQLARVMEYVIYETRLRTISVVKEIQFVKSYLELLNQQENNYSRFVLHTKGNFEKLKISPLLIAGFIDKLSIEAQTGQVYELTMQFEGRQLQFSICGPDMTHRELVDISDPLSVRIEELYGGRFFLKQQEGKDFLTLKLLLDEED